jgi:hypothetical protein
MCFFQHKPNGSFIGDKGAEGESKRVQWRHHDWTALFLTLIAYTWGTKGEKEGGQSKTSRRQVETSI